MFFQGTLQEGIAMAVQEAKLVICFVTNDGTESKLWEEEYLVDSSVAPMIKTQAVLLRLEAGSEEANYLAAIFPLPKTPTLVLIKNGELKEYIAAGTSRDDFLARVQKALGLIRTTSRNETQPAQQSLPGPPIQPAVGHRSSAAPADASSVESSSRQDTPVSSSHEELPSEVESQRQRQRQLEQEQRQQQELKEAELQRQRRREEKGKGKADPEDHDDQAGLPRQQVQQATEKYKKHQQEAQEARRRVLQQIEFDKAARKALEQERRAARRAVLEANDTSAPAGEAPVTSSNSAAAAVSARRSETCALQVRDFDCSTIRTRMPSSNTLRTDVRKWIDGNRSGSGAYTFKVLLTPLSPNKAIDETEEDRTLQDLGLAPSSTLILVPVRRFSSAYADAGPNAGFLARILAFIMGFLNSLALFFRTIFSQPPVDVQQGIPTTGSEAQRAGNRGAAADGGGGRHDRARVTGFRNPNDDRRGQQLYNGNSLNFEPRPDDEAKTS